MAAADHPGLTPVIDTDAHDGWEISLRHFRKITALWCKHFPDRKWF